MRNRSQQFNPIYLSALLTVGSTVFGSQPISAYIGKENHKITPLESPNSVWAVTITEFKIAGKKNVNNVKVHWELRADADLYKVYRDGKLIGQVTGDVYDDYDLKTEKTYNYYVEGFKKEQKIAKSIPQQAKTFTLTGEVNTYDNSNGKNNFEKTSGIQVDKKYFQYNIRNTEKTSASGTVKGRAIYERQSPDGKDNWSERELAFYPNANFEGVAVIYNKKTKKVVIAAHYEDHDGYVAAKLYLAQITPKGNLEATFCDRPLGFESRDQSIFIDDDNTAYILSATNMNQDINIYKLDDLWAKPVELINTVFKGQHRETPSIIKKDGEYYFFSSKASGWYPSQAMYASTLDLKKNWTELKELGNNSTFGTQSTGISSYGSKRSTYAVHGYHWGAQYLHKEPEGNFARLLVLNFNTGYASMDYYSTVEYHEKYGLIPVQAGRNLTLGKKVTAVNADIKNGHAAVITDGTSLNSSSFFKGKSLPYSLTIDMEKSGKISEIDFASKLTGGSETAYKYTIEGSLDGKNYHPIVNNKNNWTVGFQILKIEDQSPFRFIRLNVHRIINVHNNNDAEWADGIFEITAFGQFE